MNGLRERRRPRKSWMDEVNKFLKMWADNLKCKKAIYEVINECDGSMDD